MGQLSGILYSSALFLGVLGLYTAALVGSVFIFKKLREWSVNSSSSKH